MMAQQLRPECSKAVPLPHKFSSANSAVMNSAQLVCRTSSRGSMLAASASRRGSSSSGGTSSTRTSAITSRSKGADDDALIVPQDPRASSGLFIPLSSSNDSSTAAAAAAAVSSSARRNLRHDSRRGALVKIRVAPRRYKLRQSFDQPRRIHVRPTDPEFEGRLTSEINSTYGPRQLTKLIDDFGPYLSAAHCASAISLLAGMATGKHLSQQELQETYHAPAAKAAERLIATVQQASLLDCARAAYSLSRLQLHLPSLLSAVATHSRGQLRTATPQALAGLAAGFAHWGHHPGEDWVQELCIEAFAQMSGFGAQDLANLLFALAMWQKPVSQPFLLRCLTAFRGHWGAAGCHAPTLVKFVYALTQLPPCQPLPPGMLQTLPEGAPVYVHHEEWRRQKQAQELSRVIGMPVEDDAARQILQEEPRQQQQQQQQEGWEAVQDGIAPAAGSASAEGWSESRESGGRGGSGRGRSSAAAAAAAAAVGPATYRLPSFNWITAFLAECRHQVDRMRPAELSTLLWSMACLNHTPDLIFMECWYRASASHMHALKPSTLAMALQALGMLRPGKDVPGGVSGRWLQAVLQHSRQLLPQCTGPELAKLLWGFAELRFWPGQAWMDAWMTAMESQLGSLQPTDLSDALWALARLRYTPAEPWTQNLKAAISNALPGFSAQGLAMVIWGFSRLGLRPERQWLLRFKASSGAQYDDEGAHRLAKFVAGLLAQQNRQRFTKAAPQLHSKGGGGS